MVNDHFPHLLGDGVITSPVIWECTRFCLAQGARRKPKGHGGFDVGGWRDHGGFRNRTFRGRF